MGRLTFFDRCTQSGYFWVTLAISAWLALYTLSVQQGDDLRDINPDLRQGWLFPSQKYWPGDARWIQFKAQALSYNILFLLFGWYMIFDPATNSARFLTFGGICAGHLPYYTLRFASLRMITYNIDYVEELKRSSARDPLTADTQPTDLLSLAPPSTVHSVAPPITLRERMDAGLPMRQYDASHYFLAMSYPLLYWCGPILPYNAFVSQLYTPHSESSSRFTALETHVFFWLRWLLLAFLWEVVLHTVPYTPWLFDRVATPIANGVEPWQLVVMANFIITKEWMTLLLLWRFARGLALLDGVDTVENMPQCIHFQWSFSDVWRVWHASLNRFLVRYVYGPLGRSPLAVWPVFLLVALWHDNDGIITLTNITLRGSNTKWYVWCLFNAIGVSIEGVIFSESSQKRLPGEDRGALHAFLTIGAGAIGICCILVSNLTVPLALPMIWEFFSELLADLRATSLLLFMATLTSAALYARRPKSS